MAISYDQRKKSYEWMDDTQKQQYNEAIKNKWDDYIGNQYLKQYNEANQPQQKVQQDIKNTNYTDNKQQPQGQVVTQTPQDIQSSINQAQEKIKSQNQDLDTSKFWATNWQVTVKEWTAAQTWMPDYQNSSDARMKEITNNLNAYRQNNPEFFKDRSTFNQMFHYGERDDQQKALLDTYWKKKEDMDKANTFLTGDSIYSWMNDADITPDQLNYIKEYNNDAYREWQQKQLDDINLRIANLATPSDPTDNAELFNTLLQKLNLEPWDPYQIYDNWYNMCEKLWVFKDSEKLANYQSELDANHKKMESIMSRYSSNTWWTTSDALAAARMQKALAPYQQMEVDLQNSYTTLLNGRNSNLAVANQSASVLALQAQEDQRVFNERLQGLGFAMSTASYRSPEQQAQLQLQTAQIQNDMSLLYQAQANDLNLYNQYATTKLQNQLQNELTDLSVTDENQLRANLNNVLSGYYNQWGAIIERPQSQVVDDVIAYARKNNVSVAEALRQNFIKPLQNKKEYKSVVAEEFGLNKYQQQYSYTIDENWNVVIKASWYGEIPDSAFKTRESRQEAYADVYDNSITWEDYIQNLAGSIKDGSYGGQCGAFCNDVLIGWDNSKVFWNTLEQKIKACNVKKEEWPQVWYAVVFDLWFTSSDWENHGHVGFISAVNGDWSIDVIESNWKSDELIHVKRYSKAAVDKMVMGYYRPDNYDLQKEEVATYEEKAAETPYEWVSKTTKTWVEVNSGGWITDLENEYMKEKWDNKDVMNQTLNSYGISIQEYNAQKKKYLDYQAKVALIEDTQKMYDAVKDLLDWNQKYSSSWAGTRHNWTIDNATYEAIVNWTPVKNILGIIPKFDQQTANWVNKYNYLKNSQLLEKYQQLKKAWATFWAMQKSEWDLVWSAASNLNWKSTDAEFENNLQEMLDHYANILADAGVEWFYSTDI